jgi:hypothetical protein
MAMPNKKNQTSKIGNEVKAPAPTAIPPQAAKTTTPMRNTAVPPKATPAPRKEVTHDMIAKRAYEISRSASCGSEFDNWVRAERELKGL